MKHLASGLALAAALAACGPATPKIDVTGYPQEMRANFEVFERRCSHCHDLDRPLNARVGEGGWDAFVKRMSRHPGAAIPTADQRRIAAFLEYHHARKQAK